MTDKRFINDIDIGQLIDTKGELSTIDYSDKVDFYELWEFLNKLNDENEQLKQDNNALIHLLENQSMIIQELHSKLLEYQVKEPIVLTKEDLELMGKAVSYYTHGRYGE